MRKRYLFGLLIVQLAAYAWMLGAGGTDLHHVVFAMIAATVTLAVLADSVVQLRRNKQTERQVKRKLQHKDQVFDSLFDSIPLGVTLLDRSGFIVRTNPTSRAITGYSPDVSLERPFTQFIHADYADETIRRFLLTIEGKVQTFHTVFLLTGGYPADINVTTVPISDDKGQITGCVAIYEDITAKRQAEERIKHMAYYDDLTGLPNRRLFRDRVSDWLTTSTGGPGKIYVALLNIDHFKMVNGSLGQDIGDMMLLQLADRLNRVVSDFGMAARMDGDEFGILYRDADGTMEPGDLAAKINRKLEEPFCIQEYSIHLSASMGAAAGRAGMDESELIKHAGIALSRAKEKGKNGFERFTPEMDKQYMSKFTLENDLRRAVPNGEFLILYQPQFCLHTGSIVGAEALIRWRHPERGMVSPGEFIPLAEETGLIVPISEWVIREACRQNREWQEEGGKPIPISVNLSVRHFLQPNLPERVAAILEETGLDPSYLELEITESMTMDVDFASAALMKLKKLGLRISIDDFGTGYSSLNYLKSFPVDKLKIDRSFVNEIMDDPNDAAIVRTIITMAHHLNQTVIAEGVETEEQLDFLRMYGCDEIQGYLYSPPVAAAQIRERLAAHAQTAAGSE